MRTLYEKIAIIGFVVVCVLLISSISNKQSKNVLDQNRILLKEITRIQIPPQTTRYHRSISSAHTVVEVEDDYNTKLNFDRIKDCYDKIMYNNGWRYYRVHVNHIGGKYHEIFYQKSLYTVIVEWIDDCENYGGCHKYSIYMLSTENVSGLNDDDN